MSLPTLLRSVFSKARAVEERRDAARLHFPQATAVRLIVKPSFRQYIAVLYNVSESGLGLILPRYLEPGTKVAVLIQAPEYSSIVIAYVVHCTAQPGERWLSGCCFSRVLTDREFCTLLGYCPGSAR